MLNRCRNEFDRIQRSSVHSTTCLTCRRPEYKLSNAGAPRRAAGHFSLSQLLKSQLLKSGEGQEFREFTRT
eukprot:283981-Pleurochrysis_carterae.AAC.1